jgi:DNA-binding IclR family transcriptional regulator
VGGRVSFASPIIDRRGVTVGAVGIFGPPERLLVARQPRGELVAFARVARRFLANSGHPPVDNAARF